MLSVFRSTDLSVSQEIARMVDPNADRWRVEVYVAAASKAAATRFVQGLPGQAGRGRLIQPPRSADLHTAVGNAFGSMDEAGLFEQPCVVVIPSIASTGKVVCIDADGTRVVGDLVAGRYVPAGTLHVTLAPAQVQALRELIGMAPYNDESRALLALLPPELSSGNS